MRIQGRVLLAAPYFVAALATLGCTAKPLPPAVAARARPPSVIDIPFPDGGDRLTKAAGRELDHAARLFRDGLPVIIFVSGHSDRHGEEYDNLVLSARRARVVKKALIARGFSYDRLKLIAFGEALPLDAAMPQPADNRRVVITWR